MRCLVAIVASAAFAGLSGCASETGAPRPGPASARAELAQPDVVMEADPAPPFTYWAPEGATIRNHPRVAQVWIAQSAGQPDRYYFGDQCRASHYQHYVGQSVEALPERPAGAVWRFTCTDCGRTSDLGRARMNVVYEEGRRTIVEIDCG